jgi:hypothetical protein
MEIKDAVKAAIAFATATLGQDRLAGLRLEEIESSIVNGRAVWLITLSGASTMDHLTAALGLDSGRGREYKVFTVAKDDGEVISMKIRELAAQ